MKTNNTWWKVGVFFGAATVSALAAYPSISHATVWRQYSATNCTFNYGAPIDPQTNQPRLSFVNGEAVNNIVATLSTPFPDVVEASLQCPIVEDESVHAKGGTSVHATFEHRQTGWGSSYSVCASFDSAVGMTCSPIKSVLAEGVQTVNITPTSAVWSDGANYGFLNIILGSRKAYADLPDRFKGFWVSHT